MPAPKRPNTAAATAAVRRRGQETQADKLRRAGWAVVPPEQVGALPPEIVVLYGPTPPPRLATEQERSQVKEGDRFISGENTAETMALPCEVVRVDEGGAWADLILYTPLSEFQKRVPLPLPDYFRAAPE